jgi:class 3 adenylate cyclase
MDNNMAGPAEITARHFVPRGVLERLVRSPDLARQRKRVAEVAVLFVDVQGCSVLCEELPPPAMNHLLEVAFGDFFDCVQEAGGDVNEIMGDGFMTIFEGRPLRESVQAAAHAALAIQQHNATYRMATGMPEVPFVVNMGLHAGRAFVGVTRFVGRSSERWTYTASGPVANVAARLCALAQNGAILLSNAAADCLTEAYVLQRSGEYHFKNITYPVGVYQLLGEGVISTMT